ncbi:tetratricopeptide repeat protein [Tenacibaculum sp. A30]|uniref:tetratricopeptide repeat protein n=1 Tax=Tenacibaculum sp. A30 TaxID=3442644 RepID=UPI003EBCD826
MKTFKIIIYTILISVIVSCSTSKKTQIADKRDYNKYIQNIETASTSLAQTELNFWQEKLKNQPTQYPYLSKLAKANTLLFSEKGDISYLIEAEQKLLEINQKTNYNKASHIRSLARNYISQHRFKESLELLKKAEINGENLNATQKMLFDVYLELGDIQNASEYLAKIENYADFDYLIRVSKWYDHKGYLSSAIRFMEKAMKKAEEANGKDLKVWSYTNLADFYGHNGQIQDSYKLYLKALELDNSNAYAKKGIAWIVYSHDKNPDEALRILNVISKEHSAPDYFLLKAEIAEFKNNLTIKESNIEVYLSAVKNSSYGVMYNQHLAKLYLEEFNDTSSALSYIEKEIESRSTPQSYDLLAWYYYKNKDFKKALEVINTYVVDKTFEPEIQYHIAEIYKANGINDKAMALKEELLDSSFELGPLMTEKILNI